MEHKLDPGQKNQGALGGLGGSKIYFMLVSPDESNLSKSEP